MAGLEAGSTHLKQPFAKFVEEKSPLHSQWPGIGVEPPAECNNADPALTM